MGSKQFIWTPEKKIVGRPELPPGWLMKIQCDKGYFKFSFNGSVSAECFGSTDVYHPQEDRYMSEVSNLTGEDLRLSKMPQTIRCPLAISKRRNSHTRLKLKL